MKTVIFSVIVLLLAVSLVGTIANNVYDARYDDVSATDHNQTATNVSGTSALILALTTLVFSAGVVMMGYKWFIGGK